MVTTNMLTPPWCTIRTLLRTTSFLVGNPHFHNICLDSDRFDKDFAVADQRARQQEWEKKQDHFANLRQERYSRDANRYQVQAQQDKAEADILQTKVDHFNAGKKN